MCFKKHNSGRREFPIFNRDPHDISVRLILYKVLYERKINLIEPEFTCISLTTVTRQIPAGSVTQLRCWVLQVVTPEVT